MGLWGEEVVLFNQYPVVTCDGSEDNDGNPDNSEGGHERLRGRRAEQPRWGHSLVLSLFVILKTFSDYDTQIIKLGMGLVNSNL